MLRFSLQETKQFDTEVYDIVGSTVLTAGRLLPDMTEGYWRGEGVAIVLLDWAVETWRNGGCQWKAWSSRLISASLEIGKKRLHVVSCYAPTRGAKGEEKEQFYGDLNRIITACLNMIHMMPVWVAENLGVMHGVKLEVLVGMG